jgi:hypothetical protein
MSVPFDLFFLIIPDAFKLNRLGVDQAIKLSFNFLKFVVCRVDPLLELSEFSFNFRDSDVYALVDQWLTIMHVLS